MKLSHIINKIQSRLSRKSSKLYIKYLRKKGISIGDNCIIMDPKSITIDITRPSLVEIGNNVLLHRNFTLLTHDFISRRFIEKYSDFIPSSGKVKIGNNVSFGMDCMVMKGVTIGDNCFIGAGSIVTSDIPSNSIASGNPCKTISTIDTLYKIRKEAYKKEAYIYAQSIQERFGRRPIPADFWEEFPLFVDKTNIDKFPDIPVRRQLKSAYPIWLKNHHAEFKSFDDFIEFALSYKENVVKSNNEEDNTPTEELLNVIRDIISSTIKMPLEASTDNINMSEIGGWDSLSNMTIITLLEDKYSISIPTEEMFKMTSVYKIAQVISKILGKKNIAKLKFEKISSFYPHSRLWSDVCKNVEKSPNKVAIKMNDTSVTYAELYENVCRCASILKEKGLKPQDKIILSAHKNIEYIYIYFASHILGITNVIVDAESNKERLNYIEQKIKPTLCIGYNSDTYTSINFNELDINNHDPLQVSKEASNVTENDIAEILFTTGTTGAPKGVCLSYANIYGSASNINQYIQNTSDDIELLALPICHSFGMGRIRCTLLKGATIVIIGGFGNVQKMFKTIEDENVTGLGFVPAAWAYIKKISGRNIQKYASQIKYIEIGSASMALDTKQELLDIFPNTRICMHYGLTEASRSTFQEFHDIPHLNSIGKPVTPNVDIKIFDKTGIETKPNESGEICVKGNMVLKTYLDKEKGNRI